MAALTLSVDQEDFAGLVAVGELTAAGPDDPGADISTVSPGLLRAALAARLEELGLPWAPTAEQVRERAAAARDQAARGPAPEEGPRPRSWRRRWWLSLAAVLAAVLLWGGYGLRWQWTGFQANDQLWDWMHLLLLPLVVGTLPLWIERAGEISGKRRAAYLVLLAAFAIFVIAGYLVPLRWTGFSGNTLWDWFGLVLLPLAVASVRLAPALIATLRPHHREAIGLTAAAWLITVVGGYGFGWRWTGYQGNTLWDWLALLVMPLVVPTLMLPAALQWLTGPAAGPSGPARSPQPARNPGAAQQRPVNRAAR